MVGPVPFYVSMAPSTAPLARITQGKPSIREAIALLESGLSGPPADRGEPGASNQP